VVGADVCVGLFETELWRCKFERASSGLMQFLNVVKFARVFMVEFYRILMALVKARFEKL
jgi:hypothetical protein